MRQVRLRMLMTAAVTCCILTNLVFLIIKSEVFTHARGLCIANVGPIEEGDKIWLVVSIG